MSNREYVARGIELRVARVRAKLTLSAAAAQVRLSESHLSRVERGQRRVSQPVALALSAVYGVPVRTILRSARGVEMAPERSG